jgi:hypothetical protein
MKYISKIALTLILLISFSCSKENNSIEEQGLINKDIVASFDGKSYTQEDINNIASEISKKQLNNALTKIGIVGKKEITKNSDLYKILNVKETMLITEYQIDNGLLFYEINDNNKQNESILIKAYSSNGIILPSKKYVYDTSDSKNPILIKESTSKYNTTVAYKFQWCQQETGETASDCRSRETDEFTDDFIGFVAYYTNPTIAVLIAAQCAC